MSLSARRELAASVAERYRDSKRSEKSKILDEFTAATSYGRKHAIAVLHGWRTPDERPGARQSTKPRRYTVDIQQALIQVWEASNRLCSKRLVPYLPVFVEALERFGHLELAAETRERLLSISAATVDRILFETRHGGKTRSVTTTRPGPLLKHQIPVRTFTDWNDDRVGFLEADSVAHCGSSMAGTFLNTLVLTDIKTGWTECMALLYKDHNFVVEAITEVRRRFPFPILGLDTDNGSEFITNRLVRYCEENELTFTRSRPYKRNGQCFVEQKNGHVVRRYVGYDRYEGLEAARILGELHAVLRLWINFFQPSMRLQSKTRQGAKLRRVFDEATTPYDRVLRSDEVSPSVRSRLRDEYRRLDPVALLAEIARLQDELWPLAYRELPSRHVDPNREAVERARLQRAFPAPAAPAEPTLAADRDFRQMEKPRRKHKPHKPYVHWWRTAPDPFEAVWAECEAELRV